jgi:hypothetical protein
VSSGTTSLWCPGVVMGYERNVPTNTMLRRNGHRGHSCGPVPRTHLQDHARQRWLLPAPDVLGLTGFRVGGLTCRLAVDPFFLSAASCWTVVSGPLPSGRPRRTSDGWPASAREGVGAPLGSRSRDGPALAGSGRRSAYAPGALPRRRSRKSKGGDKSGKQDVEAAFEFCGAVVARQHGGETAQEGELADGQPVEA